MPESVRRHVIDALDPTPFGVNSHLARDEMIAELAGIGVTWQRFDVDWNEIEPERDVFEWGALDRCLDAAARLGVSVYATIAYTPAWASGMVDRAAPPRSGADFVGFVREAVRRYRGRVHALGIWNEPNLRQFYTGSRDFYLRELLVPGLRAVREEAPEIATCGPDLSSSGGVKEWLEAVLRAAGELLDVVTHHQYDGGDTVSGRAREIERVRDVLSSRGFSDRPLWITETGWDQPKTSAARQAESLRGMLREMSRRAAWWRKTFWYDSHGQGWGLFGSDRDPDAGRPRPAFFAYRDVISALRPPPTPDEASLRIVVEHAYLGVLARAADPDGSAGYVRRLRQGGRLVEVCAELFGSDEFARTRGGLPAEEIAGQLYRGILERDGDPGGLADTAAAVRAARGPARAAEMLESAEFRERILRPGGRALAGAPAASAAKATLASLTGRRRPRAAQAARRVRPAAARPTRSPKNETRARSTRLRPRPSKSKKKSSPPRRPKTVRRRARRR